MSEEVTLDEFAESTVAESEEIEVRESRFWGEVPEGWEFINGSEVYDVNPNPKPDTEPNTYIEMDALDTELPWPKYFGKRNASEYSGKTFTTGDTLFARITPCTENGKAAFVPEMETTVGIGSTEYAVLSPKTDRINSWLLYYLAKSYPVHNYAVSRMRGSTGRQRVPFSVFRRELNISLPPISEQRKIATVLYTIDRAIEKTKKILDQSRQIKKGVVQSLMTKGAHQHTSYEDYRLGPIDLTKPKEWDLRSFGEFSFRIQDGPHITPDYVDEGVPFVSSQNVNPFGEEFDYSQYEKYISEGTYEEINQNCRPEKGDLIISRRATIGPTQLIRHNDQFGFFVGVAVIKTDDTVYNPFLEQLMNWSVMNKLWHLKSPGSTMKTLNLGTIKDQKIPIPSIQEQKEMVDIIGSIDEEMANNQRYKESLQRLKRGLQQDLLPGTVRTTNTNIEVPDEITQHG